LLLGKLVDAREAVAAAREVKAAETFWDLEEAPTEAVGSRIVIPCAVRAGDLLVVAEANRSREAIGGPEVNIMVVVLVAVVDLGDDE
jgi:hypothetical protein